MSSCRLNITVLKTCHFSCPSFATKPGTETHQEEQQRQDVKFPPISQPSSVHKKSSVVEALRVKGVVCAHIGFVETQISLLDGSEVEEATQTIAHEISRRIKMRTGDVHGPQKEKCFEIVLSSILAAFLQHHETSSSSSAFPEQHETSSSSSAILQHKETSSSSSTSSEQHETSSSFSAVPSLLWCHQMRVKGSFMDICGYERVNQGWNPRVVWEMSCDGDKSEQLFAYINNLDSQQADGHGLFVLGIVLRIADAPTIAVKAYYKAIDDDKKLKLAVVDLYSAIFDGESLARVLTAIRCWKSFPYSTFTPPPSLYQRNVCIDEKFVTKVFDYRERNIDVSLNRRQHDQSLEYIQDCKVVVSVTDLVIIRYPYISGSHLPNSVQEVEGVLSSLIRVHDDGKVHMDIRASNLVFAPRGRGGTVIDFDFCSLESNAVYPSNFCLVIGDGLRHNDVACGGKGSKVHDCFSLASVLRLCSPVCIDFKNEWDEICIMIESCQLQEALDSIQRCEKNYKLKSDVRVSVDVGTGSPPKKWGDGSKKRGIDEISSATSPKDDHNI